MTAQIQTFLAGPALWFSFGVFFMGLGAKVIRFFWLSRKKDRIIYNHMSASWAAKSILPWLFPLGTVSLRAQPVFSAALFLFHAILLSVPLFLDAHNDMWEETFGLAPASMPDAWADAMTLAMVACGIFLLARRAIRPEVRVLTGPGEFLIMVLTLLPFVTGFLAFHQIFSYPVVMIAHMAAGEIFLMAIPFTRLSHMVFFFFSRALVGFEMGHRRGARVW
jgi:nitrate reductase gamma subunit